MSMVDAYIAPESLQGPYSDFYRRAMAEMLCVRLLREGADLAEIASQVDPLAFEGIGIALGEA